MLTSLVEIVSGEFWVFSGVFLLFFLGVIGLWPLDVEQTKEGGKIRLSGDVAVKLRRAGLLGVFVFLAAPVVMWGLGCLNGVKFCQTLGGYATERMTAMLLPLGSAWLLGKMLRIVWKRYYETWFSHWLRRIRYNVAHEKLSDIRDVVGKVEEKSFVPEKYYDLEGDRIFVGVGGDGKGIYLKGKKFRDTHFEIIGPTGTGKGVAVGCLLDQAIAMSKVGRGSVVVAIMPKPDIWLPHVLKKRADECGVDFQYLDLSDRKKGGGWEPFLGGNARQGRARIMAMMGMNETGGESDFFKLGEKKTIDGLLEMGRLSARQLYKKLAADTSDRRAIRAVNALSEVLRVDAFCPKPGEGLSVEKLLTDEKPSVLYVVSHLTDDVILKMTRILLMEIAQLAISLDQRRKHHLTLFVDELRFLVSAEFDEALATLSMYRSNVVMAYQSPNDLEKVRDKNLNGAAIAQSIHVNAQLKLLYRVGEEEPATWAAGQTGVQYKNVTTREETQIEGATEKWGNKRFVEKKEEWFITPNVFKALPSRVGVLINPGQKAELVYTSHVPVGRSDDLYEETEDIEEPETREAEDGKGEVSKARSKRPLPRVDGEAGLPDIPGVHSRSG